MITNVSIVKQETGNIYVGAVSIPTVEYDYRYNEQIFKSTRRRASNYVFGNKTSAEEITSRYPVGSSVRVLVNPKRPALSALEYGTTALSWIPIGLGISFTGFGVLPFFLK